MAEACKACLGPLLGFKKDELYDDDEDDEDDPNYPGSDEMRRRKKKKNRPPPSAGETKRRHATSTGPSRYVKYTDPIQVQGDKNQVKPNLNKVSLKGLQDQEFHTVSQVAKLHTLEIIDCGLKELPPGLKDCELLAILRTSRNRLTRFPEELRDCRNIEHIIMDHNKIEDVPAGVFGMKSFKKLSVLNLSHNYTLALLPQDFGATQALQATDNTGGLFYIDVSHCALRALPELLFTHCLNLQTLNVSHNNLKKLPDVPKPTPEDNKRFLKIEKLFASFNDLEELPKDIGTCKYLQKIRIVNNKVTNLPESILLLWQGNDEVDRKGRLDELLVERNPLIMPSITAFEMGGDEKTRIDKAFGLFKAHLLQKKADEAERQSRQQALEDAQKRQEALALEDREKMPAREDAQDKENQTSQPEHIDQYYFGHCKDEAEIIDLRRLESTLLLLKKTLYVQQRVRQLKAQSDAGQQVPESQKHMLTEDFVSDHFHDKIPVSDLDLYFNLMVYSTKPMLSTCEQLFDQFTAGKEMTHEEWADMCSTVSIIIPDTIRQQMWRLMAWRHPHDKVRMKDFIAAWHIHDVDSPDESSRDPWIKRITKVLHLDYYDMSVQELQSRLSARDGSEATPMLDFDHVAAKPTTGDLEANEGVRRVRHSPLDAERDDAMERTRADEAQAERDDLMKMVGLTDAQQVKYNKIIEAKTDAISDGEESTPSVTSSNLSEETDAEYADFDAGLFLEQQKESRRRKAGGMGRKQLKDMTDDDIKALMDMPPEDLVALQVQTRNAETLLAQEPIRMQHRQERAKKEHYVDPALVTDVHSVRQAIRAVHRNLPYSDFIKLINFLLRGMQLIKHSPKESLTYWHVDDPTFKHTMGAEGTNRYTRELLGQMGFVLIADVYWVWPRVHLELEGNIPTWARKEVPVNCPGRKERRLEDLIILFRSCQRAMHKEGRDFRGNFRTVSNF